MTEITDFWQDLFAVDDDGNIVHSRVLVRISEQGHKAGDVVATTAVYFPVMLKSQ